MLDFEATETEPKETDVTSDVDLYQAGEAAAEEKKNQVTYCTVKFTVGWLPGSVAFTDQAKSALAAARGTAKNAIRGSYAILGASRDPLIKQGAALKRLLMTVRDEYTIPEYTLRATASGQSANPEKVKGSYLIESCKIEEFLARFEEIKLQYLTWGKRVSEDENYQKIRAADQVALSKDWEVIASRYPSAAQMADSISCDIPKIEPFDASFTLADVAPETSRRLREQAECRLAASVEGATAELVIEFKDMVESVARNCGKRIRLLPPVELMGPMAVHQSLRHAEVMQILQHKDTDEIPEGMLLVTVQRAAEKDDGSAKLINVGKPEDLLLSQENYKALRPFETDEHRQLAQSSFDNLLWLAKKISTIKGMLGNDCGVDDLTTLATEVENTLGELGSSAGEITKQLKDSNYARNTAKDVFNGFLGRLQDQDMEIKTRKRTRRKIKVGGANG
jgi:hypothetical protein